MRLITYLAVLALWGAASLPSGALAQKPVLTQNINEPGRNPYQSVVQLFDPDTAGNSCDNNVSPNFCFVSLTPVPAGKRLVITYASTRFTDRSEHAYRSVAIQGFGHRVFLPAPSLIGNSGEYLAAGPISAYFDENDTPKMLIEGVDPQFPGIEAALVGYLVSIQ